ncbi:formyltransferase family protein [uncultured Endozoicomonas sp.]|uniref:methionyl-tRNA formyltransferase n=1 Tax=uncultured Endozoicomonas sp. TaxID=432652 RepID=UPI0026085F7D|nr:formyltransferase family protein [uncultured Endozoicomonas sp.]
MMSAPLRVLLITQGVSRVVKPLMESRHEIVGLMESAPRGYQLIKKESIALTIIKQCHSTLFGKKETLKSFASEKKIPYRFMISSDDLGLESWIRSLEVDIIVVFSMSQLLKENIFSIPKFGTINLHPSFLPEYRGPNPDFWQYYDMELNPGVTVHFIDKGEDTGDIICQERVPVPLGIKSPERLDKLIGHTGVRLILQALNTISSGELIPKIQGTNSPTERARNLLSDEHAGIIDWENWPIERIWNLLRGTELWLNALPQPKKLYFGQRWSVLEFERFIGQVQPYGTIYRRNGQYCVAAKDGCIFLSLTIDFKKIVLKMFGK